MLTTKENKKHSLGILEEYMLGISVNGVCVLLVYQEDQAACDKQDQSKITHYKSKTNKSEPAW